MQLCGTFQNSLMNCTGTIDCASWVNLKGVLAFGHLLIQETALFPFHESELLMHKWKSMHNSLIRHHQLLVSTSMEVKGLIGELA